MSAVPVCNKCGKECDVFQIDNPATNSAGALTCDVGCTAVSWCCKAGYTIIYPFDSSKITMTVEVVE